MFEIEVKDVNETCLCMMSTFEKIVWVSYEVGIMSDWQQPQLSSSANF